MRLYSEVGVGTTVSIYLPQVGDKVSDLGRSDDAPGEPMAQNETILVVEDDHRVRRTTVARVEELGYTVLAAADGETALEVLRDSPGVDLLFTDVVMPGGMMGSALADEAKRLYPNIRVLFTSGYTEQAGVQAGAIREGGDLLKKPYRRPELAAKLREILDR